MNKVLGDIQSIRVSPDRWTEAFVRFLDDGLLDLIGPIVRVKVGKASQLVPFVSFATQVPGWPLTALGARASYLVLHATKANVVVIPCAVGFKLVLRQPGLAFDAAVAAMPEFIDQMLQHVERTMVPECVSATIGVRPTSTYPSPLPPPNDPQFRGGMLWWKVDRRCPDAMGKVGITNERFERARTMALPEHVKRTFADPYLTFHWTWSGEGTPEEYAVQRGIQHQWYRDWLGLRIDPNFNDLGDYMTGTGPKCPDPAFTFYEPDRGTQWGAIGTKALVPEGGRLDPDILARFSSMLASGVTPEGTPVNTIQVTVPSREMAVECYEQARTAGVYAVLYPGKYGLMDPFPKSDGDWLHEVDPEQGYRGLLDNENRLI